MDLRSQKQIHQDSLKKMQKILLNLNDVAGSACAPGDERRTLDRESNKIKHYLPNL